MDISVFMTTQLFNFVIMPILIFIARLLDVTFGTIRVISISQGYKYSAVLVGFLEIFVWVIAAQQVLTKMNNYTWIFAYCLGYALGNYVGIVISEKLSIGKVSIRVILKKKINEIKNELIQNNFRITILEGKGAKSKSIVLFTIVKSKEINKVINIINKHNSKAFYSIENVKSIKESSFKKKNKKFIKPQFNMFYLYSLKKGK